MQFEQCQRIALRLGQEIVFDVLVEGTRQHRHEQRLRLLAVETGQHCFGMPSKFLVSARAPGREDHDDRLRKESPCHEGKRLQRTRVDPLRIIDDAQRWPVVAGRTEQRENGQTDQQPVGRVSVLQSERYLQSPLLRLRKLSYESQQRSTQLLHPCVWKLHLQFGTTDVENAKIRGRRGHMGQQRRLAYPRLPADDEHAALT